MTKEVKKREKLKKHKKIIII